MNAHFKDDFSHLKVTITYKIYFKNCLTINLLLFGAIFIRLRLLFTRQPNTFTNAPNAQNVPAATILVFSKMNSVNPKESIGI